MRLKYKIRYVSFALILFLLVISVFALSKVHAYEQEIGFEILERGDCSGYGEEAYIVVKNDAEWITIWERHTLIREPQEPPPSVDFSVNFVVCAFMGRCPTTGYSIDVERIWTDGEQVFVKVVRRGPPDGFAVGEMITCPYVMVLVEKIDMPFVFHVNESEGGVEAVFSEFPSAVLPVIMFVFLCLMVFVLKAKKVK